MKKTREQMKQELERKASEVIEALLEWNEQHEASDMTQIEEIVLALRDEIGLEFASELIAGQEKTEPVIERCPRCGQEMRQKGKKHKRIESRLGELVLEREYYYCVACGAGLFPPGSTVEDSEDTQE